VRQPRRARRHHLARDRARRGGARSAGSPVEHDPPPRRHRPGRRRRDRSESAASEPITRRSGRLADLNATKEDIANAFHLPLSFLTTKTNLANLQAAEHQHMAKAIDPRLKRRDEKLNEQLIPFFDPSGRLFLASEDPIPVNREMSAKEREIDLKYGIVTVN